MCDATEIDLRVPIGASPVGGAFVRREQLNIVQEIYPLNLYQCTACGHVQLLDVVSPEVLFADYSYLSGRTSLVEHFARYAGDVIKKSELSQGSFVIDIGSNDGAFLRFFQDQGMKVLGIDPAPNVASVANLSGIETLPVMFNAETAERVRCEYGAADVVTANNVFAHADDLQGMLDSVRTVLAEDGLFYFEVSYLVDVIDKLLLGTIFHEHLCYHLVKPLDSFLKRNQMELIDVERVAIQGGSIICTAQRLGGRRPVSSAVCELIEMEEARGAYADEFFRPFRDKLAAAKNGLERLINQIQQQGHHMAAYGAARGGTLITYLFGLGPHIEYIVDDEPEKQGLFSPGYHRPVLPTAALYERRPDYVIILAWVHTKAIVAKNRRYLEQGGRFVTFFPTITVIAGDEQR